MFKVYMGGNLNNYLTLEKPKAKHLVLKKEDKEEINYGSTKNSHEIVIRTICIIFHLFFF